MMTLTWPNNMSSEEFLRNYWQKQPLYIPGAIQNFSDPLEPEELAGMACEDDIAARIILDKGNDEWEVRHNPFAEHDFTELPATHWTVLVQDLNKYIHELDSLLEAFAFLPAWRIDDVMVSYAAPYGGVGPHTDHYDVFLLQGMGTRRWQINSSSHEQALIEGIDLRILKHFEAEQEFRLQPGDILYLPPGVQHYGVSDEPCMTYSIGFRAPTQLELLGDYIDQLTLQQTHLDVRYRDPNPARSPSGEITTDALKKISTLIKTIPANDSTIQHWFGEFITSTQHTLSHIPVETEQDPAPIIQRIDNGDILYRNPYSRFAYINHPDNTDIFIDSCRKTLTGDLADLAKHICNHRQFQRHDLANWLGNEACLMLLCAWYDIGLLEFSSTETEHVD